MRMPPKLGTATLSAVLLLSPAGVSEEQAADKKKTTKDEQTLIDYVNSARKKKNLPPLKPNATLFQVARAHSANMARQEKMEHVLDGKTPSQRLRDARYRYRYCGENIAAGDPTWPLSEVHKTWMESEMHRDNILSRRYTEIGIGIAKSSKGEVFYTQVFGRR